MPTLNIGGQRVKVGDEFLKLSTEQQNATVEEIAGQIGAGGGSKAYDTAVADASAHSRQLQGTVPKADAPRAGNPFQAGAMQGMTFGFGDELLAGAMTPIQMGVDALQGKGFDPGGSYNRALALNRGSDQAAQAANPLGFGGGELVGSLVTGGQLAKGGATLAGKATTLPGKMAAGALEGGLYGGAYGVGKGDTLDQRLQGGAIGAGTGAVTGAVAPLVAEGLSNVFARGQQNAMTRAAVKAAGTADDLKSAASQMFDQATGGTPLAVSDTAYSRLFGDVQGIANKFRINPNLDQKSVGLLQVLQQVQDDVSKGGVVVDFKDLHLLRQAAQRVAQSSEGRDAAFASAVINKVDDFIRGLKPGDILGAADPSQAANSLMQGISTWSRANKVGLIEEAIYKAGNQASGLENGLRIQFRAILQNPSTRKLFTDAERQAIEKVANGTLTSNVVRLAGKFGFGAGTSSNALGGAIGLSAGLATPLGPLGGMITTVLTAAARKGSEKLAQAAANQAARVVATPNIPTYVPKVPVPLTAPLGILPGVAQNR